MNASEPTTTQVPDSWLDFGPDPLNAEAYLQPCKRCDGAPRLEVSTRRLGQGKRYVVKCSCGAQTDRESKYPYGAAIDWNKNPVLSTAPRYDQLPFFYLADLSPAEAVAKLEAIWKVLGVRIGAAEERDQAGLDVGRRYLQRLRAYRGWCTHGLYLAKKALGQDRNGATEPPRSWKAPRIGLDPFKLGQRLINERERLKIDAAGMATVGDVSPQTQGNYELGLTSPRAEYLQRIAKCGVDLQYVLLGRRSEWNMLHARSADATQRSASTNEP